MNRWFEYIKSGNIQGNDYNIYDEDGWPIFPCCCNIFELLITKYNVDPHIQNDNWWTPLNTAIFWNKLDIVELLLKLGADPNIECNRGVTPMDIAINKQFNYYNHIWWILRRQISYNIID